MWTTSLMSYPLTSPWGSSLLSSSDTPPMDIDGLLKGLSILLVENEQDSAELFHFIFEIAEAKIETVASAGEALEKLKCYKPNILVSNIALPDMDGYTLVRLVRGYEAARGREIIAVAVTQSAREVNRDRAILAGFHLDIPKPIEPVMLVTALANLIGRR